ncbi:MAG: hypothetical protein IPG88_27435 [Gemmatimonadetes bacterium]|nr:hypothetical protein [Gemmatimonadota bacterium]
MLEGTAQRSEQTIGKLRHLLGRVEPLQHDGKLVASQAGDGVAAASRRAQAVADGTQQCVAGVMSEVVVDELEVVEVDEEDRRRFRLATFEGERRHHLLEEERAIGEARQGIVKGLMPKLALQHLSLGHVFDEGDEAPRGLSGSSNEAENRQSMVSPFGRGTLSTTAALVRTPPAREAARR